MGLIAVPVTYAAPETHANLSCVSDHLSTETTKTEFRDAGELRAEFDSINNNIETTALGVITSIEEMLPFLRSMQALLSPARHRAPPRGDAALPTWTEYCESLRPKIALEFSDDSGAASRLGAQVRATVVDRGPLPKPDAYSPPVRG